MTLSGMDEKKQLMRLRAFTDEIHEVFKALQIEQVLDTYQEVLDNREQKVIGLASNLNEINYEVHNMHKQSMMSLQGNNPMYATQGTGNLNRSMMGSSLRDVHGGSRHSFY